MARVAQASFESVAKETFTVKGKTYEVLRFPKGKKITDLVEFITTTEGKEMLTEAEAREIRDDAELNAAFKEILMPGEWTYTRSRDSDSMDPTGYLLYERRSNELYLVKMAAPVYPARVIVLKQTSEANAEQVQPRIEHNRIAYSRVIDTFGFAAAEVLAVAEEAGEQNSEIAKAARQVLRVMEE